MLEVTDFIEIDFIEAGDRSSGDAIAIRYRSSGLDWIHIVDGGYADDGEKLVAHIRDHYGNPWLIDHVVLTHSDADHASGLPTILEQFSVGCLWMNRPWRHVDALMPMFRYYDNRDRLVARLRRDFPKVAELEQLAVAKGIEIKDAFAGDIVGAFTVLSPRRATYLELVVDSDKTPVPADWVTTLLGESYSGAAWGQENLKGDAEGTSPENEMSIVQFADVCGKKLLLTGDGGVRALSEAFVEAYRLHQVVRPLDWFQVPHHGSRRNLSSDVLDVWLGRRLSDPAPSPVYQAIISANQKDDDHPKRAVVRALIHRGRRVLQTRGALRVNSGGAPYRPWFAAVPLDYPQDQED